VSPAYGAGDSVAGVKNQAPPMSPSGEGLLGLSFGAFAETEELKQEGSEEFGEIYEFSRTPARWIAEPQDPPASLYPFHAVQAWSAANLGDSVWKVPGPVPIGEEPELYWFRQSNGEYVVRESRGQFTPLGPIVAPGHEISASQRASYIEGVSLDMAHILFSVADEDNQLWPGDGTSSGRSLYEYRGASGGEPVLVGVRNAGVPPWQPSASHLNEGAELVSECGTRYNGMSASGELVLFTALHQNGGCAGSQPAANELYARVNGSRTVAISTPSKQDCAACDTEGTPTSAVFAGASEEGSKVFFATEEKLFAGAGGETATNLYEYDFAAPAGRRVRLVAPDVRPFVSEGLDQEESVADVSKNGARVYFQSPVVLTSIPNGNGETAEDAVNAGDSVALYVFDSESDAVSFVAGARETAEPPPYFKFVEPEPLKSLDTTRNGEFLVFETSTDLRGTGDTSSVPQLFEYDAESATVMRVSIGQHSSKGFECPATGTVEEGYDCDGNTTVGEDAPRIVQHAVNSIAHDGTVVFTTPLALTPESATGRAANVYEYRNGQVYLISSGDEATEPHFTDGTTQTRLFGVDESGQDVFFASDDRLVPQDTDTQSSWYDAREDGGFSGPAVQPHCVGEACQGDVPSAPNPPTLSSTLATGEASEAPNPALTRIAAKPRSATARGAEELRKALRACRRRAGRKKRVCEAKARARYAPKKNRTRNDQRK
jgi:hypothetical protein